MNTPPAGGNKAEGTDILNELHGFRTPPPRMVSFFSALALVKWLIGFVGRNDYRVFGWYRIIFGIALFAASWLGWISF